MLLVVVLILCSIDMYNFDLIEPYFLFVLAREVVGFDLITSDTFVESIYNISGMGMCFSFLLYAL